MANKTIKGLTVEIGGDTTKLGKALDAVEKKSSDLSGELREINKLLKMDPGNADLLAQKQKVLTEAVENTADKLKTLKEAEKQVQAQFKKGEASEAQVRALQREIIDTEKRLDGYKKAAKETAEDIKKFGKHSKGAADDTKDVKNRAENAAVGLDSMSKAAKDAGESSDGLKSKLGGLVKGGLQALATGVTAALGALTASAESTREYRADMGKLEVAFRSAGHSAETATSTYKALIGVIGETDQSVEAAQQIALLARSEEEAAKWAGLAAGVVGRFGDALQPETFYESANETLKLGEATGAFTQMLEGAGYNVDKFNMELAQFNSESEKQAYMLRISEEILGDAADMYRDTNSEIIRANLANEEWRASMADIGAEIEPILTDIKLLGASLLSDLLPGIKGVAEAFRGMLNGDEGAAGALGEALSGIFTMLLDKVAELLPSVAEMAINLITSLTTSIIGALPQLIDTGVQVIMAILDGATTAIPRILVAVAYVVPQLVQALVKGIPQIVQGGINLLLALAQAIPVVIPPLVAALPQLVLGLVNGLLAGDMIAQLINGAVTFLSSILQAIPQLIQLLVPEIPTIVTAIIDALISNIPVLLEGALQLLNAIVEAIPLIIETLVPMIPNIINTFLAGLTEAFPLLLDAAIELLFAIIDAIPVIIEALLPVLPTIIDTILTAVVEALPLLLDAAVKLFMALIQAIPKILPLLATSLPSIITTICNALVKNIPKVLEAAVQLLKGIISAIPKIVVELGKQLPSIITAIVSGLKKGVKDIASVGTELVKGLWNGIKDMTSWITGKLEGFGDSVLDGIKNFFGIKSPSRVFRDEVGKMLAEGLAEGIEDNADLPLDAMAGLSDDLLGEGMNGLTLERKLRHTFAAPVALSGAETGMLDKLDKILTAIERGQVLMLDGTALVGATANRMDSALGQRRVLAARGAI